MATVVSRWFTLSPMAVPAVKRKALAVMSWSASLVVVTGSASTMLPAVAVMLTLPSVNSISPSVTSVAASKRAVALAPVLCKTLVALCVMLPLPASTSMLPLLAAVLVVRMSAVPVKLTLRAASTLTLPLPLTMSALAVMSVPAPKVWISTLPVPLALMAMPSALPSWSVIEPAVVRSTIAPLPALVVTSDCVMLSVATLPVAPTRLTATVRVSSTSALASSTNRPPLPAVPVKVATEISSASLALPTPPVAPACTKRPAALTSTRESTSPSMIEPPAISATLPEL